jgi:hypothetical protein
MNGFRAFAALFVVVASGGFVACGGGDAPAYNAIGIACSKDSECPGLRCVDVGGGTCQQPCGSDGGGCGPSTSCQMKNLFGADSGAVGVCVSN